MRDEMVETGGIAQDPDGGLWRVRKVDDKYVALVKLDGSYRIEIGWDEWARGWELRFP